MDVSIPRSGWRSRWLHRVSETTAVPEQVEEARDAEARASNDVPVPLQLRTLNLGMRTILLVPLFSASALVLARGTDVDMGPFGLVFVVVAVAAGLATLLPYDRLFRVGWGMPVVFAWSVVNLVLIAIGIWATGGSSSPLAFLYALTTLFSVVAFTPRVQAVFLALTVASYSVALGAWGGTRRTWSSWGSSPSWRTCWSVS